MAWRGVLLQRNKDEGVELQPELAGKESVVEWPALPGCVSQGDTVEAAWSMTRDAIRNPRFHVPSQRQGLPLTGLRHRR